MAPTDKQAIRIGWTIHWRGVESVILFLTLVNALIVYELPELARTGPFLGAIVFPFTLTALSRGGFGKSDSMISGSLASPIPPRDGRRKERGNETDETESRSDL